MAKAKDTNKFLGEVAGGLNTLFEKSFGSFEAMTFTDIEEQEELYIPSDFLDLNRIMTGDLFGFMPPGNITVLAGAEASGKSLVGYNFLRNAQVMGLTPVLIETEYAINQNTFKNAGIVSDMGGLVVRLGYVEQAIVAIDEIIKKFVKAGVPMALCLDSLGNIGHEKTVKDIAKGDLKQDMGMLQKSIKVMLKHACHLCAAHQIPFVIVTHIFYDPSPYGGGAKIYGGQHLKFLANTTAMFSTHRKKEADGGGFQLSAFTLKNRLTPPLQKARIDIDIRTSQANRYAGMAELARDLGVFEKAGNYIYIPHKDVKLYPKEIYNREGSDIFPPEVLAEINDKLKATSYDTISFEEGVTPGEMMQSLEAKSTKRVSNEEEQPMEHEEKPLKENKDLGNKIDDILKKEE